MTTTIAILGASGYTGGELVRLLARHPHVRITEVTSERYKDKPLQAAFPHLLGLPDLICRSLEDLEPICRCDLVFCALPHLTSMSVVPKLLDNGVRVIDLSADFRLNDATVYQTWYGEDHLAPGLLEKAVYGLPERYRQEIRNARLVANPGCYPTSVLLALAPLLQQGAVDPGSILIDSKSGISGAGRGASQATLFTEVEGGFRAYKVGGHRHTPEMEQELGKMAGEPVRIRFVPHLLPQSRGILSTCHIRPYRPAETEEWLEMLAGHYRNEPFVHVHGVGQWPATNHVRGSNQCHMGVAMDDRTGWLTVLSVIDNLVKGAAGQAVQNMNLMLNLAETEGLLQLPLFP